MVSVVQELGHVTKDLSYNLVLNKMFIYIFE